MTPRVRDVEPFGADFDLLVGEGRALLVVHARLAHRYVAHSDEIRRSAPMLVRVVRALGEVYVLMFVAALGLAALTFGVESFASWLAAAAVVLWFTHPLTPRWDSRHNDPWGVAGRPTQTAVVTGILTVGALLAFGIGARFYFALTLLGLALIHLARVLLPARHVRRLALESPAHRAELVDAGIVDVQLVPPN